MFFKNCSYSGCLHLCIVTLCDVVCVFQALSLVEQEKCTLQEKLNNLNLDLENSSTEYDRLKREALARQEQDKLCINSLNSELRNFRVQFEEST